MATLTVKNNTAGEIFIADVGTNVPASGQVVVSDLGNILNFSRSASLRQLVLAATVTLNDGTADLTKPQAEQFLATLWSTVGSQVVPAAPPGFIFNARLSWTGVTSIGVGTAGKRSVAATNDGSGLITWNGILSADLSVTGPGGRQTGSALSPNQWYRVLAIGNSQGSNPPAVLFVPNGTAFSEAGYDISRRVGFVRTDGASQILKFFQGGDGNVRPIYYDVAAAGLVVLAGGAATAFTDVNLNALVPPIGRSLVTLGMAFTNAGSAAGDELSLRPKGSSVAAVATRLAPGAVVSSKMKANVQMFSDDSQVVQYKVSNALDQADLAVVGYNDEL